MRVINADTTGQRVTVAAGATTLASSLAAGQATRFVPTQTTGKVALSVSGGERLLRRGASQKSLVLYDNLVYTLFVRSTKSAAENLVALDQYSAVIVTRVRICHLVHSDVSIQASAVSVRGGNNVVSPIVSRKEKTLL